MQRRDYGLKGPDGIKAIQRGLSGAQWYASPIPRKGIKELMKRSDFPALWHTGLWLALLVGFGALGVYTWGTWYAVPAFLCYGVLYGSCGDSRWHECGHGTAFKTRWLNDVVYRIGSFMILRESVWWRWSHTRHHTDTIIVGRDPEIAAQRPTDFLRIFLDIFYLKTGWGELRKIARHSLGRLSPEDEDFIPQSEWPRLIAEARVYAAILVGVVALSIGLGSILPLMLVGLPTFYGAWLDVMVFGYTQHAGLAEDVLDHRLNTRTVYMNPVSRFIYWNMNYHLEHHMFPMVPYHALPKLHAAIKDDLPPPYPNLLAAWKEILPALIRQAKDPTYSVKRPVPTTASKVAPPASAALLAE